MSTLLNTPLLNLSQTIYGNDKVRMSQRQAEIVLIFALTTPEWILAWTLQQMLRARKLVRDQEQASSKDEEMQQERYQTTSDSYNSSRGAPGSSEGQSSNEGSVAALGESR